MNAVGYGVQLLDKEKCCGVAKIANGLYDQAKKHGNININSIRKAKEEGRGRLAQAPPAASPSAMNMSMCSVWNQPTCAKA